MTPDQGRKRRRWVSPNTVGSTTFEGPTSARDGAGRRGLPSSGTGGWKGLHRNPWDIPDLDDHRAINAFFIAKCRTGNNGWLSMQIVVGVLSDVWDGSVLSTTVTAPFTNKRFGNISRSPCRPWQSTRGCGPRIWRGCSTLRRRRFTRITGRCCGNKGRNF